MTNNPSITAHTRPAVERLDQFANRPEVLAVLHRARAEARGRLQREPNLAEAFVAIDLASLSASVPDAAGSLRVVVTRGAGGANIERHANSTQYLFVLDGPVETHVQIDGTWRVDRYGHGGGALEDRWHVIEPGLWHKTQASGLQHWAIVAFHSASEVHDEYQ